MRLTEPVQQGSQRNERRIDMSEQREYPPLTQEELMRLASEPLPDRLAMSPVNANLAIPINAAIVANVLSDNATGVAAATQATPINQIS
jgi:hypothetical protein